jgi:CBS domain-containing protein
MKVQEICTMAPRCCSPHTNLSQAVAIMWEADCCLLPVIDNCQRVVGVITDRDVAIASGTRAAHPSQVPVAEARSGNVCLVKLTDDLPFAMQKMAECQVHRLPVVDDRGRIAGVLSMNDIVLACQDGMHGCPTPPEVVRTYATICVTDFRVHGSTLKTTTPVHATTADRRPATAAQR